MCDIAVGAVLDEFGGYSGHETSESRVRFPRNKGPKQSDTALMIISVNHEKYIEVPADSEGIHITFDEGVVGR